MEPRDFLEELSALDNLEIKFIPPRRSCQFRARNVGDGTKVETMNCQEDGIAYRSNDESKYGANKIGGKAAINIKGSHDSDLC